MIQTDYRDKILRFAYHMALFDHEKIIFPFHLVQKFVKLINNLFFSFPLERNDRKMIEYFYESSHEITPLTMAVIAQRNRYGGTHTRIMEEQEEYVVDRTPSKLIDSACRFFGASLRGRQDGTRNICGITHKAPISIDPISGMYFFPTRSPNHPNCSWIAHSHIDQVKKGENKCTEIIFKNGRHIVLDVSFGSIMNQIQRTAQFRYLLDNRIRSLRKQYSVDVTEEPFA